VTFVGAAGSGEPVSESRIVEADDALEMKNSENARIDRKNIPILWEWTRAKRCYFGTTLLI